MKERPILFRGEMVLAILAGKKQQTRRLVRPESFAGKWLADVKDDFAGACDYVADPGNNPPFVVGDRLWIKETWAALLDDLTLRLDGKPQRGDLVRYRATYDTREPGFVWRSPLFMPRWASRLTLEVTDVRVERLQEISEEDARAEGVQPAPFCKAGRPNGMEHVEAFENLWESINGKVFPWSSDPPVWVVSFRRVEPEDAPP
jgi:hypothetical protein